MSHLLMTGATGLLGHYLMRDALLSDVPLAVLARSTGTLSSRERIEGHLQRWERCLGHYLPRPIVLDGDLLEPNLGLETDQWRWVRDNCSRVIHSAASVTFHTDEKTGEPYRSNVNGTRQLLSVCEDLGIREFHHISTAYVCGNQTGTVRENALDVGQSCGNDYERSKIEAEQLVRRSDFLNRPTIYRPSIIVGELQTGYCSAFHGVYTALRLGFLHLLAKLDACSTSDGEIEWMDPGQFLTQLGLAGNERKNLVPVDWVSAAIHRIALNPDRHGQTYHLTNPNLVHVSKLKETMAKAAAPYLRGDSPRSQSIPPNYIDDDRFRGFMSVYRSYFRDDPEFDTSNTNQAIPELPCPQLDDASLVRLWQYALDADFSSPGTRPKLPTHDFLEHLSRRLKRMPSANDEKVLYVQITGPGGGAWLISFLNDHPVGFYEGERREVWPAVYTNSNTALAIANGRLDIDDAIFSGRLVIEGDNRALADAESLLCNLFPSFNSSEKMEADLGRIAFTN